MITITAHRIAKDLHVAAANYNLIVNDPGNAGTIAINRNPAVVELVTTDPETRTLADPSGPGIKCTLVLKTDGGDCVVTASSAVNQAGNTIMTFNDVNDSIELYSILDGTGTFAWRVSANDGVGGLIGESGGFDLNGAADAGVLDADGDTTISAPTDDQIDFEVGGSDLMVLDADGLTAIGIRPTSETAAAITANRTLTAADSGGIFSVAKTGVYTITLPVPAQGINFKFLVLDTGANIVTILATGAFCRGVLTEAGAAPTPMTGTTLLLTSGQSVGDWVQYEGIDSTHWLVTGSTIVADDITIS